MAMELSMLYPIYVHAGDDQHAHGLILPDFPGCHSAADDWQAIPAMAQEAVECHLAGEPLSVPAPTPLVNLTDYPNYQSGVWMLVDIDIEN
jgi:predicted RNase H-like HicB family nuclease